jgi:SAM-dependent methyltransferase
MTDKPIDIIRTSFGKAFRPAAFAEDICEVSRERLSGILEKITPEVTGRFSGCGSPIPEAIGGSRILDLGCGTGRDVFLCAALAGPKGYVMGLDTEQAALAVARKAITPVMENFGFAEPNVAFRQGSIDSLSDAGLYDEDFDVVISNRALGHVSDKLKVLREVFRVLKDGGEFQFSDVYCDRRLPREVESDEELKREELGGAVYLGDFLRLVRSAGFRDPRIVVSLPLEITDASLCEKLSGATFRAVTFRLFRIRSLEEGEEDYGQAAIYKGTVEGFPNRFALDEENVFETGKALRIGGNTARILTESRFARHFTLIGDQSRHFGAFARG